MSEVPVETQELIHTSDEIAKLGRRQVERAKKGLPEDREEKERMAFLMKQLHTRPNAEAE